MGPTSVSGFGPAPITFAEIESWMNSMRRWLQPWEVRELRRLSVEYVAMFSQAGDEKCPDPWPTEATDEELRRVAFKLREAMRGG